VEIVFKPIIKPIPMYARVAGASDTGLVVPATNQPVGFDLMMCDWVAPHGKGTTPDFLFNLRYDPGTNEFYRRGTLTLTFPNAGDGIQGVVAELYKNSELMLPRYAPEEGYKPRLIKKSLRDASDDPEATEVMVDMNYFFRVRTVLDEHGKVKSALYGKTRGDIEFWLRNPGLRFTYYLNPNPNDRNMEFDPKQNLFKNLESSEKVIYP
jgi:hypothetical protein